MERGLRFYRRTVFVLLEYGLNALQAVNSPLDLGGHE